MELKNRPKPPSCHPLKYVVNYKTGRFFITLDLGLSDVRRLAPGTHPGILLIRARGKGRKAVAHVLRRVLAEHGLKPLVGCLVVADESRTRIRRPCCDLIQREPWCCFLEE